MTSGSSGTSTADLLQSISADLSALVRQELQQAQREITEKARKAGEGSALLAGAGLLGMLAAGTSVVLVVRVLDRWLPSRTAAAIATGLYAGAAGVLAAQGVARLRRALPVVPEGTVASVRQDLRAAQDTIVALDVQPGNPGMSGQG